jgi:hypothetical protein
MPRIEIQDWFGQMHTISSSDADVIKGWLLEHAEMFTIPDSRMGDVRMRIWPIHSSQTVGGQLVPDWPGGEVRDFRLTAEALGRLAEWLQGEIETDAILERARDE